MKFTSFVGKEELSTVYAQAIYDAEKRIIMAILNLGADPDTFQMSDLGAIEANLIDNDAQGRNAIKVINENTAFIEMMNGKIAAL